MLELWKIKIELVEKWQLEERKKIWPIQLNLWKQLLSEIHQAKKWNKIETIALNDVLSNCAALKRKNGKNKCKNGASLNVEKYFLMEMECFLQKVTLECENDKAKQFSKFLSQYTVQVRVPTHMHGPI